MYIFYFLELTKLNPTSSIETFQNEYNTRWSGGQIIHGPGKRTILLKNYTGIYKNNMDMGGSRGREGAGGPPLPLKKHKNIGFLRNTGPNPLKNHKAIKPAFIVGPSSARQQRAIEMAFCWRADDVPLIVVFLDPIPSKTRCQSWTISDKMFWICTWWTFYN